MLKKIKQNKVYIVGIFYILFINAIVVLSYVIGFDELKKVLGL